MNSSDVMKRQIFCMLFYFVMNNFFTIVVSP